MSDPTTDVGDRFGDRVIEGDYEVGFIRTPDEKIKDALEWARSQVGKPYYLTDDAPLTVTVEL